MVSADIAGLTDTKTNNIFEELLIFIRDSLSDLCNSDNGENGDGEDNHEDDSEPGKLYKHDEPRGVISSVSNGSR